MNNCYNNFKAPPRCLLLIIALQAIRIAHCTLHNAATLMQSFKADNATFNVREKSRKIAKKYRGLHYCCVISSAGESSERLSLVIKPFCYFFNGHSCSCTKCKPRHFPFPFYVRPFVYKF
jgi:hypothetical protein